MDERRHESVRGETAGLGPVAAAIVSGVLPVFLIGALSVQMRAELGYGESALGLTLAAFFASSALVSAKLGRLVDRVGSRRGLTWALSAVITIELAIAAAARDVVTLGVLAAFAGVANAAAQLSANVYIARELPAGRQGLGFAVKQSANPGASLVAGLALPAIALTLGWRAVFVLGAGLASAALFAVRTRLGGSTSSAPGATEVGQDDDTPTPGALVVLAVAVGLATAAALTLGGFFIESAIDAGVSVAAAGLAFAAGSIVSIAVRLGVGVVADRRRGDLLGVVAAMLALGALTSIVFTWRTPTAQLVGVPLAFGAGWAWAGLFNLSVVRAVPWAPGRATGITQTGTYVGAAVGPVLFGAVAESASFAAAWWVAGALGLAASIVVLAGRAALHAGRSHEPVR